MRTQKQLIDFVSHFIRRLNDVRFAGQVVFVIIVLLVSWSGVKSIQTNYGLQKQISGLQQQNDVQELENKNLKLQNGYYSSEQYLELAARQNFGLGAPGETEVAVPKDVALSYTAAPPAAPKVTQATDRKPAYQRHIEAWVDFFLHRQSN